MRRWLARLLRRAAQWLDPVIDPVPLRVMDAARAVVRETARLPQSGHYKRVVAIKTLRRVFPTVKDRVFGLAIERALQG